MCFINQKLLLNSINLALNRSQYLITVGLSKFYKCWNIKKYNKKLRICFSYLKVCYFWIDE